MRKQKSGRTERGRDKSHGRARGQAVGRPLAEAARLLDRDPGLLPQKRRPLDS